MAKKSNFKATGTNLQKIQWEIEDLVELRYNSIKSRIEYRYRDSKDDWAVMTDYDRNGLAIKLDAKGLKEVSNENIKRVLVSPATPKVHPVRSYLEGLRWDGKDHISDLAATVTVKDTGESGMIQVWKDYLRRWMIASVANAMEDHGCQNHTCLVLTGDQGVYKSTWLNNLCPPSMKSYLYSGKIYPNQKDSLAVLAEYWLCNIDDQLRQLNKTEENDLKGLITAPFVKYRRPYGEFIEEHPRLASLMGSVNEVGFLYDTTGNRRYLIIEVLAIDMDTARWMDLDQCWAQAAHLYKQGEQYWFDQEDQKVLDGYNEHFRVTSREEELLLEHFHVPRHGRDRTRGAEYWSTTRVLQEMESITGMRGLSERKVGQALNKHKYEKWQLTEDGKKRWVWTIKKRSFVENTFNGSATPVYGSQDPIPF